MGSNDSSRIKFDYRTISIVVVISLLVGAGAGYMVGISHVSSLNEEIDWLEAEYDSLYLAFQSLEVELNSTQELLVEEQRDNELLQERYLEMLEIDRENQLLNQEVIELESEISSLQNAYQDIEDEYEELQFSYSVLEQEYNAFIIARGKETWLNNDSLVIETILGAVDIRETDSGEYVEYVAIHPSDIDIINATIELGEIILGVDAKMVKGQEFNGSMTEFVRYFNVTRTDKRTDPQKVVGFRRGWIDLLGRCYVYEGWDLL